MGNDSGRSAIHLFQEAAEPLPIEKKGVFGDEELKALTKMLDTIKDGIIETYQGRTGLEPEKLSKMMSAETWLTAQESKDLGFVDGSLEPLRCCAGR